MLLPDDINNRELQKFDEFNRVKTTNLSPNWVTSDLTHDAWGRMKASIDYSIFHALFTFEIPGRKWVLREDWTEISPDTSTRISSISWTLEINSWSNQWEFSCLRSRRNPRYQPNRWHLYSTTIFLNSPNSWARRWGIFYLDSNCNPIDWVFFEQKWWELYWVIFSEWVKFKEEKIDTSSIKGFDITKGNLYDIQFQWRWVWDYFFCINQKIVHKITNLWTLTLVSLSNPALPCGFSAKNTDGTEVYIRSWCVDVTSEWGKVEWLTYTWVSNAADVEIQSKSPPVWMLVVHNKTTHKSKVNTRDVKFLRMLLFTDQNSRFILYSTRDSAAFTNLNLVDRYSDSVLQYHDSSLWNFTFDTAQWDIVTRWSLWAWIWFKLWNPSNDIEFIIQPWDYLVLMWEKKSTNALMSWTLEFWEEL